jgi:tRNA-uridine 2-sulfurtransferase
MSGRVIVALSGGVDSAVAALRLRRAGHEVQGLFMHNWEEDEQGYCTAAEDFQDARQVAAELGIPLHAVDLSREYRERVFARFLEEYRAGRTPNPDIACNREIKFGDCLVHAQRLGGSVLATGHYARLESGADGPELHSAADTDKDQTYFLHEVPRDRFAHVEFPLGDSKKDEVRVLAREAGLPVHDKRDSTGICFIGERPFREFLARYVPNTPGPIESSDGQIVGEHIGLPFYTPGQRSGIGIGGRADGSGGAWYVVAKRPESNTLVVAQDANHPQLLTNVLATTCVNWLCEPPAKPFDAEVRLRHRQPPQPASVTPLADGGIRIETRQPQRAVTPGQSAVIYRGSRCLGGGVIDRTAI